jgi:hypothetical protein
MFFVSNLQSSSQLDVAGSNPVSRSMFSTTCTKPFQPCAPFVLHSKSMAR